MKYSYEVELKNFKISIESILALENFILQKLNTENVGTEIILFCGPRTVRENFLAEIFNIEEIQDNFSEITSIYARYYNAHSREEQIVVRLIYTDEFKSLRMEFDSESETIALGNKQLFEKFLFKNFQLTINKSNDKNLDNSDNENLSNETSNNVVMQEYESSKKEIQKLNEPLRQSIDAIVLSKEDLLTIEEIILQDLANDYKYSVSLKPTEKYIKKNPNAKEYIMKTISDVDSDTRNWENICNYNLRINLSSRDINIELYLEQGPNIWNFSKISSSGLNQTLYYGKFYLLNTFLKHRKPWYCFLYKEPFLTFTIALFAILCCTISYISYFILTNGFNFKLLLFLCVPLLSFLAYRAIPKIKIKNNLSIPLIEKPIVQFWITLGVTILFGILPFFIK